MLITCSQHISNLMMNKLLININFKIIERVYIVALLILRVNVVSDLLHAQTSHRVKGQSGINLTSGLSLHSKQMAATKNIC